MVNGDLLNAVELDMDEYLSIANELKSYVDHGETNGTQETI
jgi:hypothetical protein